MPLIGGLEPKGKKKEREIFRSLFESPETLRIYLLGNTLQYTLRWILGDYSLKISYSVS